MSLKGKLEQKANQPPALSLTDQIEKLKPEIARLVGRQGSERIARQALTTFRQNPGLTQCSPVSFLGAIMNCGAVGLEPGPTGLVYFVPFNNGQTGTKEIQFIIGVRGWVELVMRSGKVSAIDVACVYENEKFEYELGLTPVVKHSPKLSGKGDMIAVYAIATMKDGTKKFEVMSMDEIQKVKKSSKASRSGPWVDWFDEMAKKTVVKRLCKLLPLSVEGQKALVYDETTSFISKVEDNFGNVLPAPVDKGKPEACDGDGVVIEDAQVVDQSQGQQEQQSAEGQQQAEDPMFAEGNEAGKAGEKADAK